MDTNNNDEQSRYAPSNFTDQKKSIALVIPDELSNTRIDTALAKIIPEISRSRIANWLKNGNILVNKKIPKPKDKVFGGEQIIIDTPSHEFNLEEVVAQNIPLDIVFQDEDILVINKPAGIVVHPGNGNPDGTILNGILHHFPDNKKLPRAGIVHRLDKDTSGLMVIACSAIAQTNLVQQLQNRSVSRIYRAIVEGHPPQTQSISSNIGRDPYNRIKMKVLNHGGKKAITHYTVLEYYDNFSYIECKLETGRTHQIRVHMKHLGYPLLGDPVYGSRRNNYKSEMVEAIAEFNRQALHAIKLQLIHPRTDKPMLFESILAQDMQNILQTLIHYDKNDTINNDYLY